jgi:hypothetical protein
MRREARYNIFIEFVMHLKLVRLIKMSLNEYYNKVRVDKNLSDGFPIQNFLKKRWFMAIAFQLCFRICHQEGPRK